MYDELLENVEHLQVMEKRIVMLLEFNAWTKMLNHQVFEIKESFLKAGILLLVFFNYLLMNFISLQKTK